MQFNVAQLLKEQTGQSRQYTLHEDIRTLDPEIVPLSTLDGIARLIRTIDGVLATGKLHCSLELNCSRCLEPFSYPIQFALEEEFHPAIDIITGATLPRGDNDDNATRIDDHHTLDLTEVIRQDLLLALPAHPVCRSKCLGLCPRCGKNLNEGPCDCKRDDIDPRLTVLKELLDEQDDSKTN
jgi:uncharacterized protein